MKLLLIPLSVLMALFFGLVTVVALTITVLLSPLLMLFEPVPTTNHKFADYGKDA